MGEGTEGTAMNMDTCKLDECIDRGLDLIGWNHTYPKVKINEDQVKAVGMAIAMQGSGIPYIDMGAATIKLNDDGFYNLMVGATDIGQGSDTVLAQIAAEALLTTVDKVIVYSSDTDLTPFDTGAYASSTTYVSGNAVLKAAHQLKEMLMIEAARILESKPEVIDFDGHVFKDDEKELSLRDLSNQITYSHEQKQLTATASYVGHKSPPPFMAGLCEVEVDLQTGEYDITHYVSVVDCGTPLNIKLAQGQIEGAIVQGIGMAKFEDVKYTKKGHLISNSFVNYRIPCAKDIKKLTTVFVDSYEESGPYGAKSVGEIGIDTPPAAIANAIYHATGVRFKSLPITPEKILQGLNQMKGA
jgi:CO/xanthine dehydrogenase Mo-binding subunit